MGTLVENFPNETIGLGRVIQGNLKFRNLSIFRKIVRRVFDGF